jgi:hypothetical protein
MSNERARTDESHSTTDTSERSSVERPDASYQKQPDEALI